MIRFLVETMESTVAKHSYKTSITGDQRMAEKVEDTEPGIVF